MEQATVVYVEVVPHRPMEHAVDPDAIVLGVHPNDLSENNEIIKMHIYISVNNS